MIHDQATMVLVHYFLLGGITFWRCWTSCVVLVVFVLLLQETNQGSGTFLFFFYSFSFFVVYIHIITRALRCWRDWM
jgi:hypothetical protein